MAGNMAFLLDEVGYPRHGYAAGASVPSSVSSTAEAMLISIDDLAAAAAWLAAAEPQLEQFASAGCFVGSTASANDFVKGLVDAWRHNAHFMEGTPLPGSEVRVPQSSPRRALSKARARWSDQASR